MPSRDGVKAAESPATGGHFRRAFDGAEGSLGSVAARTFAEGYPRNVAALMRSVVGASIVLVAACASIAGLEGPDNGSATNATPPEPDRSTGGTSSSSGVDQSSGEPDATSVGSPDAAHDGPTDPPLPQCLPPKKPNDSACEHPSECCSNACTEAARCRGSCNGSEGAFCNPFDDECCVGLFCATEIPPRCRKCRDRGAQPQNRDPRSCCSRALDRTGKCQ